MNLVNKKTPKNNKMYAIYIIMLMMKKKGKRCECARGKYRNFSNKEKYKKRQYAREKYKNL